MSANRVCYSCLKRKKCSPVLPDMPVYICGACAKKEGRQAVSWDDVDNKLAPPWTSKQIASLQGYQQSSTFVPFTCDEQHLMIAQEDGLRCNRCRTHQVWTYDWTLNWSWKLLEPPETSGWPSKTPSPNPSKETAAALELPTPEETED